MRTPVKIGIISGFLIFIPPIIDFNGIIIPFGLGAIICSIGLTVLQACLLYISVVEEPDLTWITGSKKDFFTG